MRSIDVVSRFLKNVRWGPMGVLLLFALGASPSTFFPRDETCTNLVPDPGFETSASDFSAQESNSIAERTTESPISGAASLRIYTDGWGSNIWGSYDFTGGRASRLRVSAHLRSDADSGSTLQFCAMPYYMDGEPDISCTPVDASAGDKGIVTAEVAMDASRVVSWVYIRIYQEGGDPLSFTLDDAVVCLDVVEQPPVGGGGSGDGGSGDGGGGNGSGGDGNSGGGGGATSACTPGPGSVYPGFTYTLPAVRPFVSLSAYTQASPSSTAYQRSIAASNAALAGDAPYAYSATQSVIAYALTGHEPYLDDAIARVEAFVSEAETAIANGDRPDIAGDSYLDIGWYLEQLSIVYDYGYAKLEPMQRARWAAFAEQSLQNLWHPADATWNNVPYPWSGWSICDPGNNYHFSFLRATMLWAIASQNTVWFDFLQTQKFGQLLDYYHALPGGGTREGTGYGTAIGNLLGDYLFWKNSTGEDLANLTSHPRETIDYWVHATVPTLDRFAPIADLSRSSIPDLYDYQENLIHTAVVLSAGTPQARRGTWWLQHNSVNGVANAFNLPGDLLPYPDAPEAPTALMYHSEGAGAMFARTTWETDAAWMSFIAGKYDQSHAHQDQGSFTFFKNDWLAVTNNIWSHSGIHQEIDVHNTLRFERTDGSVIGQNQSSTVASSMAPVTVGGVTTVTADLANAYSANANAIQAWTRTLVLSGDTLRVTDACTVASSVRPIFQLQVPAVPVLQADGSILAGNLRVVLLQPATASFLPMNAVEYSKGYRIDLTTASGCSFDVELQPVANANPNPAPDPDPDPTPNPAPGSEPIEAVWSESGAAATRVKSPAPHTRFTAGAPFRILADARDPNAWMCPPGHPPYVCPGTQVRFFVDGQLAAIATPSAEDFNLWEARLPNGLSAGDHVLTVAYVPYNPATGGGGAPVNGLAPVTIHVDPAAAHANTIVLTENVVLSGSTDLDWTDATVVGNGFTVTAASGYAGNIVIQGSSIRGLGGYGAAGIDVVTAGSVSIQNSTFEATGGMRVGVQGGAALTVKNNELRANNLLTYVSSDPAVPVALELVGATAGAKVVQGNRIGAGILRISGGDAWQIGGLAAGDGNVLIGPRAVLHIVNSSNDVIQGNYLHHDYHGGFSQGFNLWLEGSSASELAEHNVIRGGSWPVQNFGGEFRYNLVVDSGHDFWRGAGENTAIHHNVFVHTSGTNTDYHGILRVYNGESGLTIYNNTFDVGGAVGQFDAPAFTIGAGSLFASVRNNLFTSFVNVSASFGGAFVSAPDGPLSAPRVTSADYNAFYNPLAPGTAPYLAGIVANAAGLHDVHANPLLSGQAEVPYRIAEGCVWSGGCTAGQVLAHYREIYRPSAGSPLIDAGDPADGAGTAIGAVGPNTSNPVDRFGRIIQ